VLPKKTKKNVKKTVLDEGCLGPVPPRDHYLVEHGGLPTLTQSFNISFDFPWRMPTASIPRYSVLIDEKSCGVPDGVEPLDALGYCFGGATPS